MTFELEVDDNHDSYNSPNIICPRCLDKATKLCDGCKNIRYCSPECQQADRPAHKLLCRTYGNFTQHPATPDLRRIVVFLPNEKGPRFTWAPVSIGMAGCYPENERYSEDIDMNDIIEVSAQQSFTSAYTCKNAWNGSPLSRTIKIMFDENSGTNYKHKNQAVQAATQGMDDMGWRGPMIAFCGSLGGGDCGLDFDKVYDMDMQDYSFVVGFLIGYRNRTAQQAARVGPKVECVKVHCKGDRELGLLSHQIVRVPRSHPIFVGEGALSEVSERLSMPFLTWQCPNARRSWHNPQITHMHVSCDPAAAGDTQDPSRISFGYPPTSYQHDAGSHLVARPSREHLSADIVEAFGDFCQWHLVPYFRMFGKCKNVKKLASRKEYIDWVLGEITEAKWNDYLAQWKAEKEAQKSHPVRAHKLESAGSGLERMGLTEEDSWRLEYIICSGPRDRSFEKVYKAYLDGGKLPLDVLYNGK